jgi:hypothetical protein
MSLSTVSPIDLILTVLRGQRPIVSARSLVCSRQCAASQAAVTHASSTHCATLPHTHLASTVMYASLDRRVGDGLATGMPPAASEPRLRAERRWARARRHTPSLSTPLQVQSLACPPSTLDGCGRLPRPSAERSRVGVVLGARADRRVDRCGGRVARRRRLCRPALARPLLLLRDRRLVKQADVILLGEADLRAHARARRSGYASRLARSLAGQAVSGCGTCHWRGRAGGQQRGGSAAAARRQRRGGRAWRRASSSPRTWRNSSGTERPEPWQLMHTTVPVPSQLLHATDSVADSFTMPVPRQWPQVIWPEPLQ